MPIPLDGAKVRVKTGSHAGKVGFASVVRDGRDRLHQLPSIDRAAWVKSQRLRFGAAWEDHWYEAVVDFDDGSQLTLEGRDLEVIDPDELRPTNFKPQRIK